MALSHGRRRGAAETLPQLSLSTIAPPPLTAGTVACVGAMRVLLSKQVNFFSGKDDVAKLMLACAVSVLER
jgi:hypothetical protein